MWVNRKTVEERENNSMERMESGRGRLKTRVTKLKTMEMRVHQEAKEGKVRK